VLVGRIEPTTGQQAHSALCPSLALVTLSKKLEEEQRRERRERGVHRGTFFSFLPILWSVGKRSPAASGVRGEENMAVRLQKRFFFSQKFDT
jgi:hypothetical protein